MAYSVQGITKSEAKTYEDVILHQANDGTGRYESMTYTADGKTGNKTTQTLKLTQQTIQDEDAYNAAMDTYNAEKAIYDIISRGKLPILCGGTGLYLDSVLFERPFDECLGRSDVRERLNREAEEEGGAHRLYMRLCEVDPESAGKIHENNVRRVIRALEIFETTGKKKSELDAIPSPPKYSFLAFELRRTDMNERYARIERRVDQMISDGLLRETEELLGMGIFEKNPTAAQAIGYKEMLGCVRGEMSLSDARERLCIATRQYAKRQVTWFGAKKYIETVGLTDLSPDPTDALCTRVCEWLENSYNS